jgi:hypothetical protein
MRIQEERWYQRERNKEISVLKNESKSLSHILGEMKPELGDAPNDANLVITWSRNPHAKTLIPGKPSKSGLIGV